MNDDISFEGPEQGSFASTRRTILTVTLQLEDAERAIELLQAVKDATEGGATVTGFNLFDAQIGIF